MSDFSVRTNAVIALSLLLAFSGCGGMPVANSNATNANLTANNSNVNSNANIATGPAPLLGEPESYQAVIGLTLETLGERQNVSMPPLEAVVARSGNDRAMEFTLPTNEKIIYIEKGDRNFVVFPSRRQYAELDEQSLGFEVRRLMMPDQIAEQLKAVQGVKFAGEETVDGRVIQKYVYGAVSNTGTQAGTVATESFFLIDKETGLPVRSTISSQSTTGGKVQGVKGGRLVTQMKDIRMTPDTNLFAVPSDFAQIDPEQVKAQATLIFNAAAAVIGQLIDQAQASPSPAANDSPAANR